MKIDEVCMLAFVGDIHGDFSTFRDVVNECAKRPEITAVIQVGDWGWYSPYISVLSAIQFALPVYWIDGNHEDHSLLKNYNKVTEVATSNCFFVPRGTVLELDGRKVAFMGGAGSVDKAFNRHWSPGEDILDHEVNLLRDVTDVDILVSHVPPQSIIQRNFDPRTLRMFGLSESWRDPNADKIEQIWKDLKYPMNFCGHMHAAKVDYRCRILDINELFCY